MRARSKERMGINPQRRMHLNHSFSIPMGKAGMSQARSQQDPHGSQQHPGRIKVAQTQGKHRGALRQAPLAVAKSIHPWSYGLRPSRNPGLSFPCGLLRINGLRWDLGWGGGIFWGYFTAGR